MTGTILKTLITAAVSFVAGVVVATVASEDEINTDDLFEEVTTPDPISEDETAE